MKTLLLIISLLTCFFANAQQSNKIARLAKGDTMNVARLPFLAIFQKAALFKGQIMSTVLSTRQDIQLFVRYKFNGESWVIDYMGKSGTFYAGDGKIGSIVPGGKANIPKVQSLNNERDFIALNKEDIWFTSDFSGLFQIYHRTKRKIEKIQIKELQNKNLINLWHVDSTLYFDAVSVHSKQSIIYSWKENRLDSMDFDAQSISFNDSLFVFLKKGKLIVLHTPESSGIVSFTFVFLDNDYKQGLTFSTKEATYLGIDSNSTVDGVLTQKAKQKIVENLNKTSNKFTKERKNEIKSKIKKTDGIVSFSFVFLDENYKYGLTLNLKEATYLGIDSSSAVDGVLTQKAKQKIKVRIAENSGLFTAERKDEIIGKIIKSDDKDIVVFYGFFADTSRFVSAKNPVDEVDSVGIISTEKLQDYIQTQNTKKSLSELKNRLMQRAWDEEKEISINENVEIQIGAYSLFYSNFPKYLYHAGKINQRDYKFLETLTIFIIFKGDIYLYRTVSKAENLIRIKKMFYFDNPFIVPKK